MVREELWVHDGLWLEWWMLAAVMGRLEDSVGQLRKLDFPLRQWEPLKGLKPEDDVLAYVLGSLTAVWRTELEREIKRDLGKPVRLYAVVQLEARGPH